MITKVDSTIENLKNLWIELFLDKTNKVSNVADGSVLNATAYGTAKVGQKAIKDIAIIEAKLFPDTATGEYLDKCAALYGVSPRKAALGSSTYIRVYAQPGTVYDESVVFVNKNGIRFSVDQPITVDSTGYGYVGVRSINAGLATNVAPNSITTVTPQPVGHFECTNEYYAIGGRDNEDDETFRIRIKNNNNKLSKGTIEYWTQILQEVDPRVLKVMNVGLGENGIYELYIVSQNGILFTQNELDTMLEQTKDFFGLFELNLEGEVVGIVFKNAEWFYVGSERGIDFRVDINPEYNVTDVRKNIQVGLTKYLDFRFWTAGGIVQWDDLLDVVKKAEGVKFVPDEFFFPFYDEQVPLNQLPRIRGFIMRDLKGNILYDANSNLSPLFYPAESDTVFRGITDSSLALSQTVYFNVFDEQGNPIENARISVGNNSILTDPNGQGVITLINGNYTYSVNKQRYEIYQGTFIILNNSVTINVTLILAPYNINFVVIDEFNQPLPNAEIAIDNRTIVTNSNGLATIAVKNGTYPYTITKLGYEQISGDSVVVNDSDVSVSETMYLYAWDISILIQDEMAAPLPGVIVSIGSNTYLSNDEGKVSFKLVNGNYNVSLKKVGYVERNVNFTIQNQDQSFTYQMELFAYTLTMNVVDPENKPVVGAQVGLNDNQYSGITDENGTIIFKLVNGSYNYKVLKREFDDLSGSFNIQNADLELNLKTVYRHFQVIITAVDEFQKAISGATVLINNETFQTNNQGQITTSLQNGTYPYTITKLGYYDFNGNITVLGADVSDVANMTGRLYNLLFTVKQGDNFISGATVLVFGRSLTTDENGQATTQLINGNYPYTISKLGYLEYEGTAVISNQDTNVNVSLELKPWNIILTVYDRGATVAGATVAINGETLTTNESGIINTTLVNGTYDYTANKTGYVETQGQLIVNNADQSYDIIIEPIAYDVTFKVVEDTGAEPKDGFYIQDSSNKLYTKDEWNALATKPTPNGVAVIQGEHRFVVAPNNAVSPTKTWSTSDVLIEGIVSTQSNDVARADFAGKENTDKIIAQIGTNGVAASTAIEYIFANGIEGYLPSLGELYVTAQNKSTIEDLLLLIGGTKFATDRHYWASTQVQAGWYWAINYSNNTDTFEARTTNNYIRAFSPLVLEAGIPIEGVTAKIGEQPYTTNAAGEVHVNIYSGLYQVAYSKEGYRSYAGQVEVSGIEVFEQALKKIYVLDFLASSASREALADVTIIVEGNAVIDGPITVTTDAMGKTNPIAVVNGDYSYSATKTDYSSLEGTGSISNANKTENIELVAGYPTTFSVTGPVEKIVTDPIADGLYIQDIKSKLYTKDEWNALATKPTPNGVAVIQGEHRFVVAPNDAPSFLGWSTSNTIVNDILTTTGRAAALLDFAGQSNTNQITSQLTAGTAAAAEYCANYISPNGQKGYLPALGELQLAYTNEAEIDILLGLIGGKTFSSNAYWVSTQYTAPNAWNLNMSGGATGGQSKQQTLNVRAFTPLVVKELIDGPIEGASILVDNIDTIVTDATGIAVTPLANGQHRWAITKDGYLSQNGSVTIASAEQTVNIELVRGGSITFLITDDSTPVANATVSVFTVTSRGMVSQGTTNAEGKWTTPLAEGSYSYTVEKLGYQTSAPVNFTVTNVAKELSLDMVDNHYWQLSFAGGIANTSIELYRGDSASGTLIEVKTVTDSNPVIFTQLVNDTYYYVATLDGYKTLENTVIISKSNQEITLEPVKLSNVTFNVIGKKVVPVEAGIWIQDINNNIYNKDEFIAAVYGPVRTFQAATDPDAHCKFNLYFPKDYYETYIDPTKTVLNENVLTIYYKEGATPPAQINTLGEIASGTGDLVSVSKTATGYTSITYTGYTSAGQAATSGSIEIYLKDPTVPFVKVPNGILVSDGTHSLVFAYKGLTTAWSPSVGLVDGITTAATKDEALLDFNGKINSFLMIKAFGENTAAYSAKNLFPNGKEGYLPAAGELNMLFQNRAEINAIGPLMGFTLNNNGRFWSSTQQASNQAWSITNYDLIAYVKSNAADGCYACQTYVRTEDQPIADVSILFNTETKVTNAQGQATFNNVQNGIKGYTATPPEPYQVKTGSVTVNSADVNVRVELSALIDVNFTVESTLSDGVYVYGERGEIVSLENLGIHKNLADGVYIQTYDGSVYTADEYEALPNKSKPAGIYIQTKDGNLHTLEEYKAKFTNGVYIQTKDNKLYTQSEYTALKAARPVNGVYIQTYDGSLYTKEQYIALDANKKGPGIYIQSIDGSLYTKDEWNALATKPTPNGVAVITMKSSFVVSPSFIGENLENESRCIGTWYSPVPNAEYFNSEGMVNSFKGKENTAALAAKMLPEVPGNPKSIIALINDYTFPNGSKGYLPAYGQVKAIYDNKATFNELMTLIGGATYGDFDYRSSTMMVTNGVVCFAITSTGLWRGNDIYNENTGKFKIATDLDISLDKVANNITVVDDTHMFGIAIEDSLTPLAWGNATDLIPNCTTGSSQTIAEGDYKGTQNTTAIIDSQGKNANYAAEYCANYTFLNGQKGYLGSLGEWQTAYNNKAEIDDYLSFIGGAAIKIDDYQWASTQYSDINAWAFSWSDGNMYGRYKGNNHQARSFVVPKGTTEANGIAVISDNCKFVISSEAHAPGLTSFGTGTLSNVFSSEVTETAETDFAGINNTAQIISQIGGVMSAEYCREYISPNGQIGYSGSLGEWKTAVNNKAEVDACLTLISGDGLNSGPSMSQWTSTQNSSDKAYGINWMNSKTNVIVKSSTNLSRAFLPLITGDDSMDVNGIIVRSNSDIKFRDILVPAHSYNLSAGVYTVTSKLLSIGITTSTDLSESIEIATLSTTPTTKIIELTEGTGSAASVSREYVYPDGRQGDLPTLKDLDLITKSENYNTLNSYLSYVNGILILGKGGYWACNQYSATNAWNCELTNNGLNRSLIQASKTVSTRNSIPTVSLFGYGAINHAKIFNALICVKGNIAVGLSSANRDGLAWSTSTDLVEGPTIYSSSEEALQDNKGNYNSSLSRLQLGNTAATVPAFYAMNFMGSQFLNSFYTAYIPALGELACIMDNYSTINTLVNRFKLNETLSGNYWSSTQANNTNTYTIDTSGTVSSIARSNTSILTRGVFKFYPYDFIPTAVALINKNHSFLVKLFDSQMGNQSSTWSAADTVIPDLPLFPTSDEAKKDYDGKKNTQLILAALGTSTAVSAAAKARGSSSVGFWGDFEGYLPSLGELIMIGENNESIQNIYNILGSINLLPSRAGEEGNVNYYWSSTVASDANAYESDINRNVNPLIKTEKRAWISIKSLDTIFSEPIPGASISEEGGETTVLTDDEGKATLPMLYGQDHVYNVSAERYISQTGQTGILTEVKDITVNLENAPQIILTIRENALDGAPVAGVAYTIVERSAQEVILQEGVTDSNGIVIFYAVEGRSFLISMSKEGFESRSSAFTSSIATRTLTLRKYYNITVNVKRAGVNQIASVTLGSEDPIDTDENGNVTYTNILYTLDAELSVAPNQYWKAYSSSVEINANKTINVALDPLYTVRIETGQTNAQIVLTGIVTGTHNTGSNTYVDLVEVPIGTFGYTVSKSGFVAKTGNYEVAQLPVEQYTVSVILTKLPKLEQITETDTEWFFEVDYNYKYCSVLLVGPGAPGTTANSNGGGDGGGSGLILYIRNIQIDKLNLGSMFALYCNVAGQSGSAGTKLYAQDKATQTDFEIEAPRATNKQGGTLPSTTPIDNFCRAFCLNGVDDWKAASSGGGGGGLNISGGSVYGGQGATISSDGSNGTSSSVGARNQTDGLGGFRGGESSRGTTGGAGYRGGNAGIIPIVSIFNSNASSGALNPGSGVIFTGGSGAAGFGSGGDNNASGPGKPGSFGGGGSGGRYFGGIASPGGAASQGIVILYYHDEPLS